MKTLVVLFLLGLTTVALARPQEGDAPAADSDNSSDYEDLTPDSVEATTPEPSYNENDVVDDDDTENPSVEVEPPTPDAPEIPEVVLDFDTLKDLVYDFTNFSSGVGFDSAELLKRVTELELQIQKTSAKLSREVDQERNKLGQLTYLLSQIREIKAKLSTFGNSIQNLVNGVGHLGSSLPADVDLSQGTNQKAWATVYRSRGHSGRTYTLDFRSCTVFEECCKDLMDLDNDSQSIHTHDTCVTMFEDRNCQGEHRDFYPGSATNHQDFGSYNDRFSSGKPCNRS